MIMKKKRVLISGAAGFLGSHLCEKLLGKGYEVIGMDNFITGDPKNLAGFSDDPDFSFVRHDVSDYIFVPRHVDFVMHFASPASPNPTSSLGYVNLPIQTMKAGALGTHNMLGVALANKSRFLLASTSEIYGDPLEHPQKESYWGNVDPISERAVYDEAKRFAESLTMAYHRFHKVNSSIVRIFNTYGERMRLDDGRVVPNFIKQALSGKPLTIYGDGKQTRSFCYVDDLIDGIILLLESDEHLPVNLGNPSEVSILELAELVNQLTNNQAGIVFIDDLRSDNDPQRRQPDISRAKKNINWEPKVSLVDGLTRTIAYYLKESKNS